MLFSKHLFTSVDYLRFFFFVLIDVIVRLHNYLFIDIKILYQNNCNILKLKYYFSRITKAVVLQF